MSDRIDLLKRQHVTLSARVEKSEDCLAAIARIEQELAGGDPSQDELAAARARIVELEEECMDYRAGISELTFRIEGLVKQLHAKPKAKPKSKAKAKN